MRWIPEAALFILVSVLIPAVSAFPQETEFEPSVHLHVTGLREAGEPVRIGDTLILSYDRERPLRYVGAVFAHEDFAEQHIFQRNRHDVLFLAYELPEGLDEVEYRLVADGTWTTDPENPQTRRLATDTQVSVVDVSDRPDPPPEGPRRLEDGRVEFVYEGTPGRRVYVSGSFTNWDPYRHRMNEIEPGRYRIRLPLREGTHYYQFITNGLRLPDPANQRVTYRRAGRSVSRFDG